MSAVPNSTHKPEQRFSLGTICVSSAIPGAACKEADNASSCFLSCPVLSKTSLFPCSLFQRAAGTLPESKGTCQFSLYKRILASKAKCWHRNSQCRLKLPRTPEQAPCRYSTQRKGASSQTFLIWVLGVPVGS